jgi:hypothetical protein
MPFEIFILVIIFLIAATTVIAGDLIWMRGREGFPRKMVSILLGEISAFFFVVLISRIVYDVVGYHWPSWWKIFWPIAAGLLIWGALYEFGRIRYANRHDFYLASWVAAGIAWAVLAFYEITGFLSMIYYAVR